MHRHTHTQLAKIRRYSALALIKSLLNIWTIFGKVLYTCHSYFGRNLTILLIQNRDRDDFRHPIKSEKEHKRTQTQRIRCEVWRGVNSTRVASEQRFYRFISHCKRYSISISTQLDCFHGSEVKKKISKKEKRKRERASNRSFVVFAWENSSSW